MNLSAAIAIIVSVLGVALIVALTWLWYQYQKTASTPVQYAPPLRKYVVRRGQVVPVDADDGHSMRSSRWSSLRNSKWMRSVSSLHKGEDDLIDESRGRRIRMDLESATYRRTDLIAVPHMSPIQEMSEYTPPLGSAQSGFRHSSDSTGTCHTAPIMQPQMILPGRTEGESHSAIDPCQTRSPRNKFSVRTFLDPPSSSESLRAEPSRSLQPEFPRPAYLSPSQGRKVSSASKGRVLTIQREDRS